MEKSRLVPDANPRKQIATAEARQRTNRIGRRRKANEVWRSIFGSAQPEWTPGHLPPTLQTGKHVFEVDGVKSGEAEKDKIWAQQRLAKNWSSHNLTIYTDGSAKNRRTAIGGEGILLTAGHQSNPTIHHSYAIQAGKRCSSFQAEMKAIKKALQIIQKEESPQKVRIVSDSQSVLLRIANLQPAIPVKSADVSEFKNLRAALNDKGHQMTFTWCPIHCGVVGNEMAEEQARKGAAANQEDVRQNYDSVKAIIRRATRLGDLSHEGIRRVCGVKGE